MTTFILLATLVVLVAELLHRRSCRRVQLPAWFGRMGP
jgi:hypothetical protein